MTFENAWDFCRRGRSEEAPPDVERMPGRMTECALIIHGKTTMEKSCVRQCLVKDKAMGKRPEETKLS